MRTAVASDDESRHSVLTRIARAIEMVRLRYAYGDLRGPGYVLRSIDERANPRPWRYESPYIVDATGKRLFEKVCGDARPDAALAVEAVNERAERDR